MYCSNEKGYFDVGGSIPSLATTIPKDLDDFTEIVLSKAPPKIITEFVP